MTAYDVVHGVRVDDPFRWLEVRQSPRTVEWLAAQAAHARRELDALPGHTELLKEATRLLTTEIIEGLHLGRESIYFLRRAPGDDQASLWAESRDGSQRLLVDAAQLDPSGRTSLDILAVSHDERAIAFGKRDGCRNEQRIAFIDPASASASQTSLSHSEELPASEYRGIVPIPARGGAYYAAPHEGSWRVAWHRFGTSPVEDVTAFVPLVPSGSGPIKLGVSLAQDGQHLLVLTARRGPPRTMDLHVLPIDGSAEARLLLHDTEFFGGGVTFDGHFYFLSHEHASRRKVLRISLSGAGEPQPIIPECEEAIRRVARAGDKLLLVTSANGHDRIRLFDFDGGRRVDAPESVVEGKIIHLACHPLRQDFYVATESWRQPRTILRWNADTRAFESWWKRSAPIGADSLTLETHACPARDGERVTLSLIRVKNRTRATPTLLIAYGGYGVSMTPTLSLRNAMWLATGGQLAVAGLRGGGEHGRQWHDAGARENRQTAINDLLDVVDWLESQGYTSPDRLTLAGASHAGTLVAAAMTQRPERFAAVVCSMALLDLVRFESSTRGRWSAQELGTTADEAQFRALLSYSPYHRVRDGVDYPAVLFVSGDEDTLVDPLHVRKMTARLQQATTSGRAVLLSYDERRGHRGQLPLADRARALADQIAFLLAHTRTNTRTNMADGAIHALQERDC